MSATAIDQPRFARTSGLGESTALDDLPRVFQRLPRYGDVFELRVVLRHIEPLVWRSVSVPAETPLIVLHDVLQIAFGWTDSHLHRTVIRCTGGARACPPEDCGGPHGYANLLSALADPKHPDHDELRAWAPRRFDAEKLDLNAVNKKLAALSKRVLRRRKP